MTTSQGSPVNGTARVVRTVCSPNCGGTCGIDTYVEGNRIVRVEPASFPDERYRRICLKGIAMAMQRIEHEGRLRYPLRRVGDRGSGQWERVSWETALSDIASRLKETSERYGEAANSWISMTGNYGMRAMTLAIRVANCLGGTAFTNLGIMGDLGCNMGLLPTLGVQSTAHEWADAKGARLIVLFGKNIADTAHSEMHFLFDAMDAGARVIAVDPRFSRTAAKADEWIAPRPGTDAALMLAMLNVIIEQELYDSDFVRQHTNAPFLVRSDNGLLLRTRDIGLPGEDFVAWNEGADTPGPARDCSAARLHGATTVRLADGTSLRCRTAFDVMVEAWKPYTCDAAAHICEIPADVIHRFAVEYATTKPAALWLGQGMQRYWHGHLAFRGAATLAALCGNIGLPHSGVSWCDGPLFQMVFALPQEWLAPGGKAGRVAPGTRMHGHIATGSPWPIKSLWTLNYGFGTQSPRFDAFVRDVLPQLDLFVVTDMVMTPGAQYADYVLPCLSFYEEDFDLVGGLEMPYVQLRRRAIEPVGESRSDWDIFKDVCERLGRGGDWTMTPEETCRFILERSPDPAVHNIDWETLRRDGVARANRPETYVPFEDRQFPTPSGRVELYTESLHGYGQAVLVFEEPFESPRRNPDSAYPLSLVTNHHVHTTHSQHVTLPWIREVLPGPLLNMHPRDAEIRGIGDGCRVAVFNARGRFEVDVSVTEAIKPGVVSIPQGWWPEHFPKGHYGNLHHITPNPVQDAILESNFAIFDNLVQVERVAH